MGVNRAGKFGQYRKTTDKGDALLARKTKITLVF